MFFPMLIQLQINNQYSIINEPEELPIGVSFKIVEINTKFTNELPSKPDTYHVLRRYSQYLETWFLEEDKIMGNLYWEEHSGPSIWVLCHQDLQGSVFKLLD